MKKNKVLYFSIVFLSLFSCLSTKAQQKVGEFPIGISNPKEAILISNKEEELACISHNNKEIEVNFLAEDYSVIKKAIITKLKTEKNIELKGALLSNEYIYIYAFNPKLKSISSVKVSRKSGEYTTATIKVLPASDHLLSSFAMEGRFYFLTVPKNTNSLSVIKLEGDVTEEIKFDVPMTTFYASLSRNNELINNKDRSDVAIQKIATGVDSELSVSSASKKLYYDNGIIRITFDEPALTHLLTLDPVNKTIDYKKLTFSLEKGNNSSQKQGNSYIYQNRLIRGTMSPDQLNLAILNLDSMSRVNNYNSYPEEEIAIANTPLMEESVSHGSNSEVVLKNSNQYFKHVLRGDFAVTARSIDGENVEVKVGGVERFYVNRGGGPGTFGMPVSIGFGIGMGGMGLGTGGMGMGYPYGGFPSYGYPGGGYGPSYAGSKISYFKSVFNASDFSHQDGYYQTVGMTKRMDEYKSKVFRSNYPDIMSSTFTDSKGVLGYYRKNGRKFILVEFLK